MVRRPWPKRNGTKDPARAHVFQNDWSLSQGSHERDQRPHVAVVEFAAKLWHLTLDAVSYEAGDAPIRPGYAEQVWSFVTAVSRFDSKEWTGSSQYIDLFE